LRPRRRAGRDPAQAAGPARRRRPALGPRPHSFASLTPFGRVARLGPDGPSARLSCGLRPRSLLLVGPAKPDPTRPRGAGGGRPPRAPPTTTHRFVVTGH